MGLSDNRTNLLVFISPRIIESKSETDALTIEKQQHMQDESSRFEGTIDYNQPWFRGRKTPPAEEKEAAPESVD